MEEEEEDGGGGREEEERRRRRSRKRRRRRRKRRWRRRREKWICKGDCNKQLALIVESDLMEPISFAHTLQSWTAAEWDT